MNRKLNHPSVERPSEADMGERLGAGDEGEHEHLHRLGGEVGLHAVPDDADDAADDRRRDWRPSRRMTRAP